MVKLKIKADMACQKLLDKVSKVKKGDIAFEYVIILVIMAAVIFVGWRYLGNTVLSQISKIGQTMDQVGAAY